MTDLTPELNSLLKSHEAPITKRYQLEFDKIDAYIREAYRINTLISDLHSELKDVRKAYLSTAPQRKSQIRAAQPTRERTMTDREREDIDANAKQMIRELNASIRALDDAEQLRRETQAAVLKKRFGGLGVLGSWAAGGLAAAAGRSTEHARAAEAAAQVALHRDGVLWLLRRRLEMCCTTQQHMMETRLTREMEKNKSVLARSAQGSIPLPGMQPGAARQTKMTTAVVDGLPPDQKLAAGARSGAERHGTELTQEQVQMFEQGNRAMMEHYENALDKVRGAEKSLVEISELQSMLVNNLATQSANIEQLVADSLSTTENVGGGNKELKKATQRPSAARYTFFAASGLCAFLVVWDLII
ncbi:uncharacterized protein BROUX77_005628 [Berkeleyomyces rouxiae]|uniref:uncharacterized protein n=1 Tax=Berkeleyomyces rouxiae TaxID=2035830 RepID=UPI003B7B0C4E